MRIERKHRVIPVLLTAVIIFNILDISALRWGWECLKALASASDYSVGFTWSTSELEADADGKREVTLSGDGRDLTLKELVDENPILRTVFSFNMRKPIEAGDLTFTITGLDELIRSGVLTMNMNDPNLVKTWEITKVDGKDEYTFKNLVRVTSNNETTFTWQFNSRAAINTSDIELKTKCTVTEVETVVDENDEEQEKRTEIPIDTGSLHFRYYSEHDKNQVKIVCQDPADLDVNNLNVQYDWRSYRSVLGLEGMSEYDKDPSKVDTAAATDDVFDAHHIVQSRLDQEKSLMSRGIKSSDYFIEVSIPEGLTESDILIVNSRGERVGLQNTVVNGKTLYGFYDFQGKGDIKPGESYSSTYRVGVLNSRIDSTMRDIILTGHYIVTYNDETSPQEYTDKAGHHLLQESVQNVGKGNTFRKFNSYEINWGVNYNGVQYDSHSKHYLPQWQLLYDSIFNGRVVTYSLYADTPQLTQEVTDNVSDEKTTEVVKYDLVYEDGAPTIANLNGNDGENRVLDPDEYDFVRVFVPKLIDGNTVGIDHVEDDGTIVYKTPTGFRFQIYGRSSGESEYRLLEDNGNTAEDSEVFLPEGIDEIRVIVRDLGITASLNVRVDVRYNIHEEDRDKIYIDNENDYITEDDENGNTKKVRHEATNKGTRLVNTFKRMQYSGKYEDNNIILNDSAHSNSWLRESTTAIDSSADIEEFAYHDAYKELLAAGITPAEGFMPSDYYTTRITAGGTVQSDSERGLNHFIVYSKLPDNVSPSDDWLDAVKESMRFSAVLQGSNEPIDESFIFDENAVTIYYDEASNSIAAEFSFDGYSLKMDEKTSCTFAYPAEITLAQVKALNQAQNQFTAETYVTVLDDNVKLSAIEGKTLLESNDNPYLLDIKMSKASDKASINALGSQKSNYSSKQVASFYNNWVYENSTQVDGSNTDRLDPVTGRMTSEYTYQLAFYRLTTENEIISDPMMLDIVEGLRSSNWQGAVQSVTFDDDSIYSYKPEVYYLMKDSSSVTKEESGGVPSVYDYSFSNEKIKDAIANFQKYGNTTDTTTVTDAKEGDLNYYYDLKSVIESGQEGWQKAVRNGDEWVIGKDDVYAVAIIFKGKYLVSDKFFQINAYLNMKAPALENSGERIINNTAAYNESHVFAEGTDKTEQKFPMYSVGNRTLVILKHTVELEKVSAKDGRRLSGASFDISTDPEGQNIVKYYEFDKRKYTNEEHEMKDMSVDLSGILQLNLSPGIYYYREIKAPRGYEKDNVPYKFRVIADSNAVYNYTVGLKTAEELANEYIIIRDSEYKQYISEYSGKTTIGTGSALYVYDSEGGRIDKFRKEDDRYEYDKYEGSIDTVYCGESGSVTFKWLPAGTYFLGTAFNDPDGYWFSVADNSEITFHVFRKDAVPNAGYEVHIISGDETNANYDLCFFTRNNDGTYSVSSEETQHTVTEIWSDSNGRISVKGLDPTKHYYLMPSSVPEGYRKSALSAYDCTGQNGFTVYAAQQLEKTGRIVVKDDPIETVSAKFRKIDGNESNYGALIDGAVYNLYQVESDGTETKLYFRYDTKTGKFVYRGTTGSSGSTADLTSGKSSTASGMIELSGLGYGTYFLQEAEAPLGYQLDTVKHYFRVSAATITEDGELRFVNENVLPETDTDPGDTQQSGDSSASASSDSSSGDSGEDSGGTGSAVPTATVMDLKDDEILSTIELNKTEELNTDKYLRNATYTLFRLNPGMDLEAARAAAVNSRGNTDSDTFKSYWTAFKNVTTNVIGQATITGVPFGTYLLYEVQPPVGYKWNNDSSQWETWTEKKPAHQKNNQIIVLSPETLRDNSSKQSNNDGGEEVVYHSFYAMHKDERKDGEARLLKRSGEGVGLLDGNFTLCRVNLTDKEIDTAVRKYYPAMNSEEFAALTAAQKKNMLEKVTLTADDIELENHFTNGKPVTVVSGGSEKTVDTVVAQNLTTNKDGLLGATDTVTGLEWGIYYFYEVKAPTGYQRDTLPLVFTVDAEKVDTISEIEMTDEKKYGEAVLLKYDENDTLKYLPGAVFSLTDKSDAPVLSVPYLYLVGAHQAIPVKSAGTQADGSVKLVLADGHDSGVIMRFGEGNTVTLEPDKTYSDNHDGVPEFDDLRYCAVGAEDTVYSYESSSFRKMNKAEKDCITSSYVTTLSGMIDICGLDWASYCFRETSAPSGYGIAEDVTFTVNSFNCDYQLLECADPTAKAAIIIDKEIPEADMEYFEAYGEPTFLFKVYGLTTEGAGEADSDYVHTDGAYYKKNGKVYTLPIHLSDLNRGTVMISVDEGQYLIEEMPVSRYSCYGLSLIAKGGTKVYSVSTDTPTSDTVSGSGKYNITSDHTAFCDLTGGEDNEMLVFHVEYRNKIDRYDNFSQVSFADNRVPGRTYITSFKPMYTEVIPVDNDDTKGYVLKLGTDDPGNFSGVLNYNVEDLIKYITDGEVRELEFTVPEAYKDSVSISFDRDKLELTVSNPLVLAGQTITLDVGYPGVEKPGNLELTFGEVKADVRKKLVLKNDTSNRSYFPYADPDNQTKDVTSVAVIYTMDAGSGEISKSMENTDYTDELKLTESGWKFICWYLLDKNGKPVLDNKGDVIQFKATDIEAYMFNGTWPEYLTTGDLLPEALSNPADVANVNTFTFQAEVGDASEPKAKMIKGELFNEYAYKMTGVQNREHVVNMIRVSTPPSDLGMTESSYARYSDGQYYYDASVSQRGTDEEKEKYPLPVYIWGEKTDNQHGTIYWYSEEPHPLLNENCDLMFCFYQLPDTTSTHIEDFDARFVTRMRKMFAGSNATYYVQRDGFTSVNLNWDTSNVTTMEDLFRGRNQVSSFAWENFSTDNCTNLSYAFDGVKLPSIEFLHGLNTSNIEKMDYAFCSGTASTVSDSTMTDKKQIAKYLIESWSGLDSLKTNLNGGSTNQTFRDWGLGSTYYQLQDGTYWHVWGSGNFEQKNP